MCYVFDFAEERRPSPVQWALPVDMAKLISSLKAYQALRTLHLCRKYRPQSSLARLPQEVIDRVVSFMLEVQANDTYRAWAQAFACYQLRCQPSDHSAFRKDYATDPRWRSFLSDKSDVDCSRNWWGWRTHEELKSAWKYQTCACDPRKGFCEYKKILETHFGITAAVHHESVLDDMHVELPDYEQYDNPLMDTMCFLVPTSGALVSSPSDQPLPTEAREFSKFDVPRDLYSKFATARRILQLDPRCSIFDIEKFITTKEDMLFNSMCPQFDTTNKRREQMPREEQINEQKKFLDIKHRELAKQRWPQPVSWSKKAPALEVAIASQN